MPRRGCVQRVTILYDASQAVLSTFDLDEVLKQILAIVRDYFNLENGSIFLMDEGDDSLYVRTHFGSRNDTSKVHIAIGQGTVGAAAAKKRPIYLPDVPKDANYIQGIATTRS